MPATRLLLLRHGEVELAYQRVFGGRIDMNLSETGHEQARHLAEFLRRYDVDALYCSSMKRARQTAEPIRMLLERELVVLSELCEVDFGDWTGMGWDEVVMQRYQVRAHQWLHKLEEAAIPSGEHSVSFRGRVEPCLKTILAKHPGETIAIVSHGGVVRMILSILLGLPLPHMAAFEVSYASLTHVDLLTDGRVEIQLLNLAPWLHHGPSPLS